MEQKRPFTLVSRDSLDHPSLYGPGFLFAPYLKESTIPPTTEASGYPGESPWQERGIWGISANGNTLGLQPRIISSTLISSTIN